MELKLMGRKIDTQLRSTLRQDVDSLIGFFNYTDILAFHLMRGCKNPDVYHLDDQALLVDVIDHAGSIKERFYMDPLFIYLGAGCLILCMYVLQEVMNNTEIVKLMLVLFVSGFSLLVAKLVLTVLREKLSVNMIHGCMMQLVTTVFLAAALLDDFL